MEKDPKDKIINDRAVFYKKPIKKDNYRLEVDDETPQEVRRKALLLRQKKDRDTSFNNCRGLIKEVLSIYNEDADDEGEEMKVQECWVKHSRKQKYRNNNLMLSEWMLEVPEDLVNKWVMIPCPVGKRNLLVACKGITKVYNKQGRRIAQFHSALPGGNKTDYMHKLTLVDCIWQPDEKVYYALDVLAWSNQGLMNCDTDFRLFWLHSKLSEDMAYQERDTETNVYPIVCLPKQTCDSNLSEFLMTIPKLPSTDGLLFYHREGHYTRGRTPLVTWLKPYMLEEVLGIYVPEHYQEKPAGYIDVKHFFASERKTKKTKNSVDECMESGEIDVEDQSWNQNEGIEMTKI